MSLVITIVLLGLLASVSPSTIVVFILLLATARARVNAAAFLIGWSLSLIIVFAVSYAIGEVRATQHGSGSTAVEVIEILLGVALAFAAARQWRRRDRPRTSSGVTKKFTARLKQLNPWEAATVGLIFLYFARRPGQAEAHLSDLRDRLVRAGPAVFAIVSGAVGVFLIIDGVTGIVRS